LTIRADRIARNRINWKLFLEDDSVLPAIAKVIGIDKLGASLPQYLGKTHCALVFDRIHPHAPIFGVWLTEVSLASTELVHMSALPPHCDLNCIVQLRQRQRRGNKQTAQIGGLVPSRVTLI
jgi:hypothetical protein